MFKILIALCLLANLNLASGECANACNGHGKCTSYDMCICNRNWQAADCSERVCQFGLAHVDTPKGDLDASGGVTNANKVVVTNSFVYPYGTTEQFPQMQNSDLKTLTDTAHYYMECSNKGRCDRTSGECQCFDGYDGVACQRASCPGYPNSCSGHGVCKTISQIASADNGNVYKLWDKDTTMGCECDPGYFGPDCSQRKCKYGVDPLYLDDAATIKYPVYDFATLTTHIANTFTNGENEVKPGYFAIRFFDNFGEDWLTEDIQAGAPCSTVVTALENLPNDVIKKGSLKCVYTGFTNGIQNKVTKSYQDPFYKRNFKIFYKLALWEAQTLVEQGELSPELPIRDNLQGSNETAPSVSLSGHIYRVFFQGNPGAFRQPEIEVYLDGKRPTLVSPGSKVITKVWTDGQQGEYNDYFGDFCDRVSVTIGVRGTIDFARETFLTGMTRTEKALLKKCLGDSDENKANNQDIYNWDKGDKYHPHIVKLVRTTTTNTDGGYYAVLWYDTASTNWDSSGDAEGTFRLLNPFAPPDNLLTDNYNIYTTKGTLSLTSFDSEATFGFGSRFIYTTNTTYDTRRTAATTDNFYDGDLSCERTASNGEKFPHINYCLNKSDIFTIINWEYPHLNPPNINLYTVERLYTGPYQYSTASRSRFNPVTTPELEMHYMTHMITTDIAVNWGAVVGGANPNLETRPTEDKLISGAPHYHIYKFVPAVESTYNYVAECSNRGICDRDGGVCKCFPGYTSDSCSDQQSIAL